MKILISNDDGVREIGLSILVDKLSSIAEIYVMAPLEERSATGHTLTLHSPLKVRKISSRIYGCDGYPADCVLLGFKEIFKDEKIDLIVSGINNGSNLGQDIYYSGTVAVAREGTLLGVPSIAVSLVVDHRNPSSKEKYFETAALFVKDFIAAQLYKKLEPLELININVPMMERELLEGLEFTYLGRKYYDNIIEKKFDRNNDQFYTIRGHSKRFDEKIYKSDCACIKEKKISISILNLLGQLSEREKEWTHALENLKRWC